MKEAPCRVKIIKCSYEAGWYKDLIGEEFDVDNASPPKDFVVWQDMVQRKYSWRHIKQEDCIKIFKEPVNISTKI